MKFKCSTKQKYVRSLYNEGFIELGVEPFWEVEVNEVNLSNLEASYVGILENAKDIEHVHHGFIMDGYQTITGTQNPDGW